MINLKNGSINNFFIFLNLGFQFFANLFVVVLIVLRVRESTYLKGLGCPEKSWQLGLRDVHLPRVHELQQGLQMLKLDIPHEYYRMLAGICLQDRNHKKFYFLVEHNFLNILTENKDRKIKCDEKKKDNWRITVKEAGKGVLIAKFSSGLCKLKNFFSCGNWPGKMKVRIHHGHSRR